MMRKKQVAIFDLDGTLMISQGHHATAESRVLARYGVTRSPDEITAEFAGISDRILFAQLLPNHDTPALVEEKWTEVYLLVQHSPLLAMPGMLALVRLLHAHGHHIAIASASPRTWIERCLAVEFTDPCAETYVPERTMRFGDFFGDRYVSARDCAHGKPYPDVYLAAYKVTCTSVPIEESWAIGDAVSDVQAGLAAGMRTFFLSDDARFDDHPRVTRFSTSQLLAAHLCSKIT